MDGSSNSCTMLLNIGCSQRGMVNNIDDRDSNIIVNKIVDNKYISCQDLCQANQFTPCGHLRRVRRALRVARAILTRQSQETVQVHVDVSDPLITATVLCCWRCNLWAAHWRARPALVHQSLFDRRDNRRNDRDDRQRRKDLHNAGQVEPAFHTVPAHPTSHCPGAATQRANCQPEGDNNQRGRQNGECSTNQFHLCAPAIPRPRWYIQAAVRYVLDMMALEYQERLQRLLRTDRQTM